MRKHMFLSAMAIVACSGACSSSVAPTDRRSTQPAYGAARRPAVSARVPARTPTRALPSHSRVSRAVKTAR
ncbi:MAG: hypothetical protein JWO05_2423 [Gemmatimonadetes bacterium]|nr:hypothetical protein [Gemmatimonadota bacterium]